MSASGNYHLSEIQKGFKSSIVQSEQGILRMARKLENISQWYKSSYDGILSTQLMSKINDLHDQLSDYNIGSTPRSYDDVAYWIDRAQGSVTSAIQQMNEMNLQILSALAGQGIADIFVNRPVTIEQLVTNGTLTSTAGTAANALLLERTYSSRSSDYPGIKLPNSYSATWQREVMLSDLAINMDDLLSSLHPDAKVTSVNDGFAHPFPFRAAKDGVDFPVNFSQPIAVANEVSVYGRTAIINYTGVGANQVLRIRPLIPGLTGWAYYRDTGAGGDGVFPFEAGVLELNVAINGDHTVYITWIPLVTSSSVSTPILISGGVNGILTAPADSSVSSLIGQCITDFPFNSEARKLLTLIRNSDAMNVVGLATFFRNTIDVISAAHALPGAYADADAVMTAFPLPTWYDGFLFFSASHGLSDWNGLPSLYSVWYRLLPVVASVALSQ